MHVDLGGYHISDIEFSAAFDIDREKVGYDLGEAIFAARTTPSLRKGGKTGRAGPSGNDP